MHNIFIHRNTLEREELSYVQRKHEELVERAQSLEASLDHFREELQTSRSHAEKSTTCLHDVRKVLTDASCEMKQLSGIMAPLESQFLKIQQGKQTALRLCAEKISAAEALIAGQSSLVHYQKVCGFEPQFSPSHSIRQVCNRASLTDTTKLGRFRIHCTFVYFMSF